MYLSTPLKLLSLQSTNETCYLLLLLYFILKRQKDYFIHCTCYNITSFYPLLPQFRKSVDQDCRYNIEADRSDNDKERYVVKQSSNGIAVETDFISDTISEWNDLQRIVQLLIRALLIFLVRLANLQLLEYQGVLP